MTQPNWIVTLAHNNPDLLIRAVESFEHQDISGGVCVLVVNNESDGPTTLWINDQARSGRFDVMHFYPQRGVAHGWNAALRYIFSLTGSQRTNRALVVNSDVVLRPDTYRCLDEDGGWFVTAVGSNDPGSILPLLRDGPPIITGIGEIKTHLRTAEYAIPRPDAKRPHPDFSCFLIRRECWERVGPFDENFRLAFCEDSDYHCRMHAAGITAYAIDLPFWHVGGGSQTIKRADDAEREAIAAQAARNRAYFEGKWGFEVPTSENGGVEYYRFFRHGAPPEAPSVADATPLEASATE